MQLNDGNSVLAGRKIQFDTADYKQRKKRNNKRGSFDNFSRGSGFDKVEYIPTENMGFRANGERHPHSWSIIDKVGLIKWILNE